MTWILEDLGSNYNQFSPEPDMDEWHAKLIRRFDGFSGEDKAKHNSSQNRYLANIGRAFRNGSGAIDEEEWPDVIRLKKTYKRLPDLFHVWHGLMMVSARMRALLDRFDQGVHVFRDIPFDYQTEDTFFAFHTPTRLQAINIEASDPECVKWFEDAGKYRCHYGEIGSAGLVFDAAKTEGRGFWRDTTLFLPCYCFSDDFKTAMESHGLYVPKLHATKATN